jgi:hypothetical protein
VSAVEQYAETAILVAVMNGDLDRAKSLIAESLNGELVELHTYAGKLIDLVVDEARSRGLRT